MRVEVWFALFPHTDLAEIEVLEGKLIPVAEAWNKRRRYHSLLNLIYKSGRGHSEAELPD